MLENHSLVRLNAEFFERHKDHAEILGHFLWKKVTPCESISGSDTPPLLSKNPPSRRIFCKICI